MLLALDRAIKGAAAGMLWVAAACILVIVALGTADTLLNALFKAPLPGVVEITETLLVAVIFLGVAYSLQTGRHVAVDVLTTRLPHRARMAAKLVSLGLTGLVFGLIAWRGTVSAADSVEFMEIAPGLLPVPIWPAKIALALGAWMTLLECLRQLVRLLAGCPDPVDAGTGEV